MTTVTKRTRQSSAKETACCQVPAWAVLSVTGPTLTHSEAQTQRGNKKAVKLCCFGLGPHASFSNQKAISRDGEILTRPQYISVGIAKDKVMGT